MPFAAPVMEVGERPPASIRVPSKVLNDGWSFTSFKIFDHSTTTAKARAVTTTTSTMSTPRTPASPTVVVACIACERAVLVSHVPDGFRSGLGLHVSNADTFLPSTCWHCEQDSNVIYNRMTNTAATIRHDWPGFISARMLQTWWLYCIVKEKYGVECKVDHRQAKMLVRIRDIRKKMLKDETRAELLVLKADAEVTVVFDWRTDSFFGQPLDY